MKHSTPSFWRVALALACGGAITAGCASRQHTSANEEPVLTTASVKKPARREASGLPTIEQFLGIRAPGSPRMSPDGSLYVRDWPDGVWQVYVRRDGANPDAPFEKLTDYKDGVSDYSVSPDGAKMVLAVATGGNEQFDLHLLDPATGAISVIKENPNVVYRMNEWLDDSSGIVFAANDDSPTDFHLYRYDFATGSAEKILAQQGDWGVADVSPDNSRALVYRSVSISDTRPFELSLSTGELRPLSLAETPGADEVIAYLPGEREVLMVSDREEGRARIFVKDLATGAVRKPLPNLDAYEIDGVSLNKRHDIMAVALNRDGFSDLRLYRLPGFEPVRLPSMEEGVVGGVSIAGDTVVYAMSNARQPGVAYAFQAGEGSTRQITTADTKGVDLSAFVLPKLVKYRSFDGLEIPAFLYLPPGHRAGQAIPFIVDYHGGPEGQHRPGFSAQRQFMLSRGYGILLPNVRGSTGYGKAFHELDNYKNRWNSVRDGVEAARWLVQNGYSEPGMIAAYGGSYGGFMASATVVEDGVSPRPVFGASVNIVGIVNFETFLEQTKGYRRALREVEYGPLTDREFLRSVSPIHRADEIKVPMLIAHGLNDPRVPIGEALQLDIALKKRGQNPELLIFPDEGHGFAKLENRLVFANEVVSFLDRTIGAKD